MSSLPQFSAQPVIVIHLPGGHAPDGRPLAACVGEPYGADTERDWTHIPRVLCTGCLLAVRDGRRALDMLHDAIAAHARVAVTPVPAPPTGTIPLPSPPPGMVEALLDAQRERGDG